MQFRPRPERDRDRPAYALDYIRRQLELVGLEDSWAYVDYQGGYHGKTRAQVAEACAGADLMVNLSGGCWMVRPEYEALPKVFIDDRALPSRQSPRRARLVPRLLRGARRALYLRAPRRGGLHAGRDAVSPGRRSSRWSSTSGP